MRVTHRSLGPIVTRGTVGHFAMLLVALAGIFAMHGLSDHGTAGHAAMDERYVALTSHVHPMDLAASSAVAGGAALVSDGVERPWSDMGAMDLCLGVLGVGLLMWLLRSTFRTSPARVTRVGWSTIPGRLARAPDPPDLIRLSIQRC